MKKGRLTRYILLFSILMLLPVSVASAKPNVMDDLQPETDLPDTSAPVVKYNEYPIDNYQLDIYTEDDDSEGGFMDAVKSLNPFAIKDEVIQSILAFQQTVLSGIWYGYTIIVNAGLYFIEQAFTFDLIGSMIEYVADLIAEIGGPYGIGQFIGFMLILTSAWLVYTAAKMQFRRALGGIIIAALISGFFTFYVQNSGDFLNFLNDKRLEVSNAVLSSSTYSLDSDKSDEQVRGQNVPRYTDATASRYGLSRIRNLLHDLLIVKPYMLMEFGSTNLAVVGGAKNKNEYTQENIDKGKEKIKTLLSKKPGSSARKKFVADNHEDSMFAPELTNQRTVLAFLVWFPAIFILGFSAFVSFFVQIYGTGFLIQAAAGVFILMLAIMPTFRSFASQWLLKLLNFLAMSVAFTFSLILMFSLVNIVYKVAEDKNWNYLSIVTGVAIVVITMIVLSSKFWGYQIIKRNFQKARDFTNKRIEKAKERKKEKEEKENNNSAYTDGYGGGGMNPAVPGNRLQRNMERMNQAEVAPIKSKDQNSGDRTASSTDKLLKGINNKKRKKGNRLQKKPGQQNGQQLAVGNRSDNPAAIEKGDGKQAASHQQLINQMQKRQSAEERIKQQPRQSEKGSETIGNNKSRSEEALQSIRRQEAQEKRRIKMQPKTPDHLKPDYEQEMTGTSQNVSREQAKMKAIEQKTKEGDSFDTNVVQMPRRDQIAASIEHDQSYSHSKEMEQMRKRTNENKGE